MPKMVGRNIPVTSDRSALPGFGRKLFLADHLFRFSLFLKFHRAFVLIFCTIVNIMFQIVLHNKYKQEIKISEKD